MFFLQAVCLSFPRGVISLVYFTNKMVKQLIQVTSEYEKKLRRYEYVPKFWHGRRMLRDDGGPNRFILMYRFCEQPLAIQFSVLSASIISS
jgi:hypothetical protein